MCIHCIIRNAVISHQCNNMSIYISVLYTLTRRLSALYSKFKYIIYNMYSIYYLINYSHV